MLKLRLLYAGCLGSGPAAFRRLCVETKSSAVAHDAYTQPPLGGCVLKHGVRADDCQLFVPAAFRRLCVETPKHIKFPYKTVPAAFRRLCVETQMMP